MMKIYKKLSILREKIKNRIEIYPLDRMIVNSEIFYFNSNHKLILKMSLLNRATLEMSFYRAF